MSCCTIEFVTRHTSSSYNNVSQSTRGQLMPQASFKQNKVLIIGLDGATFDLLDPIVADGAMPFLRETMQYGAAGRLRTVFPPVTAPAFASFLTGMNPGKHGIYEFLYRRRKDWRQVPVNSLLLGARTFWQVLSEAGRQVGVLSVPLTYPPQPLNGFALADFLTPKGAHDLSHPRELIDEVERQFGPYPLYHSKVYTPGRVEELLRECNEILDYRARTAIYLMQSRPWDVLMVYLEGTDRVQHELWHILDENHPAHKASEAAQCRQAVIDFYTRTDERVRRIVEAAGPDTTLLIMSDHGFGPIRRFVNMNMWLWQHGFLHFKGDIVSRWKQALFQRGLTPALCYRIAMRFGFANLRLSRGMNRRFALLRYLNRFFLSLDNVDWSRTVAYSQGNYGQIYLNLKGREPFGVVTSGLEAEAVLDCLAVRLRQLQDPASGEPIVERVLRRQELYQGAFIEQSPDLVFLLRDAYKALGTTEFSSHRVVEDAFGNSGDHRMDGIIVMRGAAIRPGRVDGAHLIDLAPTILTLAQVPIPANMDGCVLEEAIQPAFLAEHPPTINVEQSMSKQQEREYTAEEESEIVERLRMLGYTS